MSLNVLFICAHNSSRSILAEAALNHIAKGRFQAFSAASHLRDQEQPNPMALKALTTAKINIEGLRSKSWSEFTAPGAPEMDLVITMCEESSQVQAPVWPGKPATAQWEYKDPTLAEGSDKQKQASFNNVLLTLRQRLDILANLPAQGIDRLQLQQAALTAAALKG
jgi:protein-tyrosine-phosphatase